jgi:hypothetical protein
MDQATLDNLYLQQAAQYERDIRLQRMVTMLQGLAAFLAVIVALHYLIKKT